MGKGGNTRLGRSWQLLKGSDSMQGLVTIPSRLLYVSDVYSKQGKKQQSMEN